MVADIGPLLDTVRENLPVVVKRVIRLFLFAFLEKTFCTYLHDAPLMQDNHQVGLRQELQLIGAQDDSLPLEEFRQALIEQSSASRTRVWRSTRVRFAYVPGQMAKRNGDVEVENEKGVKAKQK